MQWTLKSENLETRVQGSSTTVYEFFSRQISIYAPFISTSSLDDNQNVTKVVYFNEFLFELLKNIWFNQAF